MYIWNINGINNFISASPMISFSARTFKTFVNYPKAMINKFIILKSIYLSGFLNEKKR